MNKRKLLFNIILIISLFLLLTAPAGAEFYQSGLEDFIKTNHKITVPMFSPAKKYELKIEADSLLKTAGQSDLELKKSKKYYITQADYNRNKSSAETEVSGWGVQIMASSTQKNALEFKNNAAKKIEAPLFLLKEDGLFKVAAGAYTERKEAEKLEKELKEMDYSGWVREVKKEGSAAEVEAEFKIDSEAASDSAQKSLKIYNSEGKKLREAHVFKVAGDFQIDGQSFEGEYQFGPLADSVLFSCKTGLEELTAYLLQNNMTADKPVESLKAQAVLYRTSLLYQLEIQGARLESLSGLEFKTLNPVITKAVGDTESQVLIKNDEFYYNSDYSLRELRGTKKGFVSLAYADYDYQEMLNYYYDRAEIADLKGLLDSKVKYTAKVEPGLKLKEIRQKSWSGPRVITILDYDLKSDNLKLKPVLAQGVVPGRADLKDLIKRHSALAGINGGYFHYSGRPLGLIYLNGRLVSEPLYNRSAILISSRQNISFAQVGWQGELEIEGSDRIIKLDGVNREPDSSEVVLFNHFYGSRMPALNSDYHDIVIRNNKILGIESKKGVKTAIPPDGFVLRISASRNEMLKFIRKHKNSEIKLKHKFSPDFRKNNIMHAVGGGPRLLKDGKIDINGEEENFQNDILNGRAPRTAVGLTEEDHLLMLTIDGRQSDLSVGMTLKEVAETLRDFGAVEAVNLDGGGSARMVIRGFTMSNPSEKRLISNGVIVEEKDR